MSHHHCAIRFTDPDHSVEAHVVRDCFGRPEDTLTNLAHLSTIVDELPCSLSPRTVATQFIVIDSLSMGQRERTRVELYDDDLMALAREGSWEAQDQELGYLCHHSIEGIESSEALIWCYEVEVEDERTVRVSELTRTTANTA